MALALFSPRPSTSSTRENARKRFEGAVGSGTGDQQIEVAHGLAAAAQAAGGRDGFHAGDLLEVGGQLFGHGLGVAEQIAAAALAVLGDGAQHLLFELGAHAGKDSQFLFGAEPLELVHGADAEVFEDEGDALGAEPLNLEEFERGGWKLLQQQVAPLAGAAFDDLGEHDGEPFADAGDVGDFAFGVAQNVRDALGVAFDGGGAVAVAADAEAVFAGDLHQVGRLP